MNTRYLIFLPLLLSVQAASAQTQAQTIVLTLGDDAQIQVGAEPDGSRPSQPAEPVSGGLTASLVGGFTGFDQFLATDFRLQSKSLTISINPTPCGGPNTGTFIDVQEHAPVSPLLFTNEFTTPSCIVPNDTAVVSYNGQSYTGIVSFEASFTGTVDNPQNLANLDVFVTFGKGNAEITGSLMVDLSDDTAPVVKLRQGILPIGDGSPPWERVQYDSQTGKTIANEGCLLTSLSMALNSTGIHMIPVSYGSTTMVLNNPGTLNTFVESAGDYDSNHNINTSKAIKDLGLNLNFVAPKHWDSEIDHDGAQSFLENALAQGHPITVGVDSSCPKGPTGFPCHFVLVWGERNGQFLIADPWPNTGTGTLEPTLFTSLSQWGHYITGGYVTDPENLSALNVTSADDVSLLLTSPNGTLTGIDPVTGTTYQQGGAYWTESLVDALNPPTATKASRFIDITEPVGGQYELATGSPTLGTFSVTVNSYAQDGSRQPAVSVTGIGGPESNATFDLTYTQAAGSLPSVSRISSPAGLSKDLQNAVKAGLIKMPVVPVLEFLVRSANDALKRGRCREANGLLDILIAVVNQLSGHEVDATVAGVLLEDATSLHEKCSVI